MSVTVFTTRPDTIYGATFVAISAETAKSWFDAGWETSSEVLPYVTNTLLDQKKAKDYSVVPEKTGVFSGVYAINPATNEKVPVWVANYVLGGVGTGAIMCVPAHDERDYAFAKKYNLPITEVVRPYVIDHVNTPRPDKATKIRRNVHAIVYDPKNKKYLIIRNSIHKWDTIVIGGVEEGEDLVEAAKRELVEETGYTDVVYKRTLGNPVQAGYFAPHKDENRLAIASALYFELESDARVPIATDGENEGNEIMWVSEAEFVPGKMVNSELSFWLARLKNSDEETYIGDGVLVNSDSLNGITSVDAKVKAIDLFGGKKITKYKIEDWTFARQRYWGEPFPVVRDESGKVYMVDESELPVLLPDVESYEPTGTGESPLAAITDWVNVKGYITEQGTFKISADGKPFTRETNTMPQWAGSSWYYLRFADPHNDKALIDPAIEKAWQPVDVYVGGDHATRHLIYARFWHKFLYDIGVVSSPEPFFRLEFLGFILAPDGRKMSKRWGNVIDPDDVVNEYGADTLRVYEMFMAPFEQTAAWSTTSIKGTDKFLDRVYNLQKGISDTSTVQTVLHKTIKKVTEDIEGFKFNTAVSQMMILVNAMEKGSYTKEDYAAFLRILAPFAPHLTEQVWSELGNTSSIHTGNWPAYDTALIIDEMATYALQINGKLRGTVILSRTLEKAEVIEAIKELPGYKQYVGENTPKKIVFVPGKLINIVI
jgi:leucyl-tRNA synthetase